MSWVCLEQLEVLSRESLHMPWQFVITSPERSKRMGLHGIGLKFPPPISASIFSRAAACFPPGEKSCSNSSSQTSTAASISVRLTLLRWPQQRRKPIRSRPEAASASLNGVPLERARWIGHMGSNVPAHRRRASDVRLSTAARSRRSVQPVCCAFFSVSSKMMTDRSTP
jgi:hypothetical protein